MHFLHLDLIAYGAFTNRRLEFRSGARLHVVYGPNEAGKSTTLQAIGDLLFGFPARKAMDFRHDASALRVGAALRMEDGRQLSVARRRGNKATLRDPEDDEPLDDELLLPFLGGIDRPRFERELGLTAEAMRAGGETLAGLGGDLGGSLLAASSGLGSVRQLRETIEAEADAIFSRRKSKDRAFWIATDERDAARAEERDTDLALSAQEWRETEKAIRDTADAQKEANANLAAAEMALASAERRLALRPALRHLDQARRRVAEFEDLSALADDLPERIERALGEREAARQALRQSAERQSSLKTRRETLTPYPERAEAAEAVRALAENLGRYRKDVDDVPKVRTQLRERQEAIRHRLADLGIEAKVSPTIDLSLAERTDLRTRALRLQEAEREGARLGKEKEAAARRLQNEVAGDEGDALPEIADLERAVAALAPVFEAAGEAVAQMGRSERALQDSLLAAARFDPPVDDLETHVDQALPSESRIEAALSQWRGHRDSREHLARRMRDRQERMEAIHDRIARAERSGSLADPAELGEARGTRDERLAALRSGASIEWKGLEDAIARSDRIADRLLAEAEQGGELRRDRADLDDLAAADEKDRAALADLDETIAGWQEGWGRLFRPFSVAAPAPERAEGWIARLSDLVDDAAQAKRELAAAHRVLDEAEKRSAPLRKLSAQIGLSALAELDPLALWNAVGRRLSEVRAEHQERAAADALRREHERSLADLENRIERSGEMIAADRRELDRLLKKAGLREGHGAEAVLALLEGVATLTTMREEAARLLARFEGLEADVTNYREAVGAMLERLAPDLTDAPLEAAVSQLWQRCEAAVSTAARLAEMDAELADAATDLANIERRAEAAEGEAQRLLEQLPEGAEPASIVARLRERRSAAKACADQERQFADIAQELTEDEVRTTVETMDEEAARAEMHRLTDAKTAAQDRKQNLAQEMGRLGQQLETLRQKKGSDLAAFRRRAAEERMEIAAREWGRLRAASILLDAAMERYARCVPNTTLDKAGELFATLTDGAFSGLAEDLDAEGQPILLVVRPDGARMSVSGTLSEGTRDQLYLALRLAALGTRAEKADLPPFIGDDLFASFDDRRTKAGLTALAQMAPRIQPILFTHHRAVVESAGDALGEGLDLIEL